QNRLLKIAREGGQMTSADLMKFERGRRCATLVALAVEGKATVTDEVIDLHDRIVGKLFNTQSTSIRSSFKLTVKRSMISSGSMGASARLCSKPNRTVAIPSPPSRRLCHGRISRQASRKRRSSRNRKTSTSSIGSAKDMRPYAA